VLAPSIFPCHIVDEKKTCEHMVTNHQELGKPLDVGTEEHKLLED
jgi:hypothetical protein